MDHVLYFDRHRSQLEAINKLKKARNHNVSSIDTAKNKTKFEKKFFAQKLKIYPYFLEQKAFLTQTNCAVWKILNRILLIQPQDISHSVTSFRVITNVFLLLFFGWSSQMPSENHRMLGTSPTKIKSRMFNANYRAQLPWARRFIKNSGLCTLHTFYRIVQFQVAAKLIMTWC